jgi:hypothetical protein
MTRPGFLRIGFLAALLALAGQLAWAATVPDPALAQIGLGVICHASAPGKTPTGPSHRGPDCILCPLCAAIAMPVPTLARAPPLPPPRLLVLAPAVILSPATAPSVATTTTPQPRAPPVLG